MTQVIEKLGGEYRNRTGVHGFAIRCVTTPPTRRSHGSFKPGTGALQGAFVNYDVLLPARNCVNIDSAN